MNEQDWKRLSAYHNLVKSTRDQIENVERLVNGIRSRSKKQAEAGWLRVSVYEQDHYTHDHGCYVNIPVYVAREAIVPALVKALQELRTSLKGIKYPPQEL